MCNKCSPMCGHRSALWQRLRRREALGHSASWWQATEPHVYVTKWQRQIPDVEFSAVAPKSAIAWSSQVGQKNTGHRVTEWSS